MLETNTKELLNSALPYLRSYRDNLLKSRSGAADDKEQYVFALHNLVQKIEKKLRDKPTS